jgi:hypothetical protein
MLAFWLCGFGQRTPDVASESAVVMERRFPIRRVSERLWLSRLSDFGWRHKIFHLFFTQQFAAIISNDQQTQ